MCTAATYKTKDFYFGRTFDYELKIDISSRFSDVSGIDDVD